MISYSQALEKFDPQKVGLLFYRLGGGMGVWENRNTKKTAEFVTYGREVASPIFYGVEMEFPTTSNGGDTNDFERMANYVHPFGTCYNDGCFEVITSPATFRATKTILGRFFDNMKDEKGLGTWHRDSGSHIHFSTPEDYPYEAKRMVADFICDTKFQKLTEYIGGRPENWACKRGGYDGKDSAVNRDTSHGTYEVRIFKCPKTHLEAHKNLEFVDSLITYFNEGGKYDPDVWQSWLTDHAMKYPNLITHLRAM